MNFLGKFLQLRLGNFTKKTLTSKVSVF